MIDQELRVERSAVDLYFLELDGSSFKATFVYKPYFFIAISKDSLMQEVEAYLMRRFDGQIDSTAIVSKEDLELVCVGLCVRMNVIVCLSLSCARCVLIKSVALAFASRLSRTIT